jgi:DNA replication protein DnaC
MRSVHTLALSADTQQKQLGNNSREVKIWLKKLKDALDDVLHLLDDFSAEDLRRQEKKDKKFQIFFSSSNQFFFSSKMAAKVKELTKRIEGLQKFSNFHSHPCEQRDFNERESLSFILEQNFIGREKEKKDLIKLLLNTNTNGNNNVSGISIVGKEGIGKTALAQLVYNDKEVQRHFEWREWVWVSKFFNVPSIFAKIIEAKYTNYNMKPVYQPLREKVNGKRYLLVLDDLWNESHYHWSTLTDILKLGAKGSKIIVTTRSEKVAKITTKSSPSITLDKINEEHSWRMFCLFAFDDENEPENQNLVSIGKEIVKKCNGIPLAIYSIGRLMYSKKTENDWLRLKDKDLVNIDEEGVLTIYEEDMY